MATYEANKKSFTKGGKRSVQMWLPERVIRVLDALVADYHDTLNIFEEDCPGWLNESDWELMQSVRGRAGAVTLLALQDGDTLRAQANAEYIYKDAVEKCNNNFQVAGDWEEMYLSVVEQRDNMAEQHAEEVEELRSELRTMENQGEECLRLRKKVNELLKERDAKKV